MCNEPRLTPVLRTSLLRTHLRGFPSAQAEPMIKAMAKNLVAKHDFSKGDVGRVTGYTVVKTDPADKGATVVVALQPVKAGMNGWFEPKAA